MMDDSSSQQQQYNIGSVSPYDLDTSKFYHSNVQQTNSMSYQPSPTQYVPQSVHRSRGSPQPMVSPSLLPHQYQQSLPQQIPYSPPSPQQQYNMNYQQAYAEQTLQQPREFQSPMYYNRQPSIDYSRPNVPQQQEPIYLRQPPFQRPMKREQNEVPRTMPSPEVQRHEIAPRIPSFMFDTVPPFEEQYLSTSSKSDDNSVVSPLQSNVSLQQKQQQEQQRRQQQYQMYAYSAGNAGSVSLDFEGNLLEMQYEWTPEEWSQKRRLVQFWRNEKSNRILCGFQPVAQEAHGGQMNQIPGLCIVSCVFWEARQDYIITSVDLINLLQFVMDISLSMEEKNRIRRNLEGFKPTTVSKGRPDTADFFRVIMNFPNPKPRNIEKDVKVFEWSALPYALKKIVTKYRTTVLQKSVAQEQFIDNSASGAPPSVVHQMLEM
ncbi:hypothetical protein BJV82DRAFT_598752 [Fennellomyces sp. T-0311]|nr:hypothetical protein BJV82DRAFT_598752 [Fennellomyces sp. T-0311]